MFWYNRHDDQSHIPRRVAIGQRGGDGRQTVAIQQQSDEHESQCNGATDRGVGADVPVPRAGHGRRGPVQRYHIFLEFRSVPHALVFNVLLRVAVVPVFLFWGNERRKVWKWLCQYEIRERLTLETYKKIVCKALLTTNCEYLFMAPYSQKS